MSHFKVRKILKLLQILVQSLQIDIMNVIDPASTIFTNYVYQKEKKKLSPIITNNFNGYTTATMQWTCTDRPNVGT